jgi:hypothetical protein
MELLPTRETQNAKEKEEGKTKKGRGRKKPKRDKRKGASPLNFKIVFPLMG